MNKRPIVTIIFENFGEVTIELYPEYAKETVNNFICLIDKGYYKNMAICRIVNGRLIQSGDPNMKKEEWTDDSPGYILNGEFNNLLSFKRGTLGMAMAANEYTEYSTAGSFFIMNKDEETLDSVVTAFGRVIFGMDVVDKINMLETYNDYEYDAPFEIVKIEKISVELFGVEYREPKKIDSVVLKK